MYTLALLKIAPDLNATIFDLPHAIAIARGYVAETSLTHRATFVTGDFVTDTLPAGHDLALVSAIIHQNSLTENVDLYRKVRSALVPGGRIVVRDHVMLVFRKFSETWRTRQTFRWFHEERVKLPVDRAGGGRRNAWQLPNLSFINGVLHNPFYAGAYVYGQRQTKVDFREGRLVKRQTSRLGPEQCRVFLPDHHDS